MTVQLDGLNCLECHLPLSEFLIRNVLKRTRECSQCGTEYTDELLSNVDAVLWGKVERRENGYMFASGRVYQAVMD